MPESITPAELFTRALEARLRDLHVALPCKVTKVDMSNQTVDVAPVLSRSVPRGDDLAPLEETLPTIQAVPLVLPRGGGFFLSVPVQVGDFVLCVFSERDIGRWWATGQSGNPGDQRMHPLSGAMAIPGVFPDTKKLADASGTDMVIGKDGGLTIKITSARVEIEGSSDSAALASRVKNLETAMISHVHPGVTTGAGSTGVSIQLAPPAYNPQTFDSTKLKLGG